MPWVAKDYTGKTFGYLTGVKRVGTASGHRAIWQYQCACGKLVDRIANSISYAVSVGLKPSCGCKNFTTAHTRFIGGETVNQFAARHGLRPEVVWGRLHNKWPEHMLGAPLHTRCFGGKHASKS